MEGIIERGQAYKPYKENRKVPPDECLVKLRISLQGFRIK